MLVSRVLPLGELACRAVRQIYPEIPHLVGPRFSDTCYRHVVGGKHYYRVALDNETSAVTGKFVVVPVIHRLHSLLLHIGKIPRATAKLLVC
ncbi:unknown [Bacteroides sp. CAG:927]|nr:unknown [Bacteroides sp. CAG:927]